MQIGNQPDFRAALNKKRKSIRLFPVLPYASSYSVTAPAVKLFQLAVNTRHSEVIHPASDDLTFAEFK